MSRHSLFAIVLTALTPWAAAQTQGSASAVYTTPSAPPGSFLGGTDDCATPMPIAGQGQFPFDLTTATTGVEGQNEALCYFFASSTIDSDVWFCWTADADGCAELTTCGLTTTDTKVAVYPGCGCPANGTAIVCNDDACPGFQTTVQWPVTNGATFTIQLGTFPGATPGTGLFDLSIPACPTPGPIELVAHYKLDESSGNVTVDSGPGGFDGIYVGGVTLGLPGAAPGTGTSVELDDTAQGHSLIANNPVFDAMRNDLSVSAWVNPQSYGTSGGIGRIFGNVLGSWTCGIRDVGLRFTTSGILDYDLFVSPPPLDEWTHVVFSFDVFNDVTFYMDGVNLGTLDGNQPSFPPSQDWNIGSWDFVIEFFDGQLDDIQVYRGALDDDEVAFLFNNPGAIVMEGPGEPLCFGDGAGTFCPCGNDAAVETGCTNSSGVGALLLGDGDASFSADTMVLTATDLLPSQPCLFFQGDNQIMGGNGVTFGDGLRCCGTNVVRLVTVVPDGSGCAATDESCGTAIAQTPGPISQNPANTALTPGDTRCYQCWYRDPSPMAPCGSTFNLTNAYQVTWLP